MTKARNIADLLDANGIVDNAKITLDANEIPNLDASKIVSGDISAARLSLATETKPVVSSVSPSVISNDAQNIVITGTDFTAIPRVDIINTATGIWYSVNTVTHNSATQLTVNLTLSVDAGTYRIRVENPDGLAGLSGANFLTVSDAPTWSTSAGSLGTKAGGLNGAVATVSAGGDTIVYSETTNVLTNASLANCSLNSSTGAITTSDFDGSSTSARTHTFTIRATDAQGQTSDREFTLTSSYSISTNYLVIAGGGGGAKSNGGGGGAGGYRNSFNSETSGGGGSSETALEFTAGTQYTITIGQGGAGNPSTASVGDNGGYSSITGSNIIDIYSTGGGGGGNGQNEDGIAGGSGGGGASASFGNGGAGTSNQGFAGGNGSGGTGATTGGGGGGGAFEAGENGVASGGGHGGNGLASAITGSSVTRGGGGGGSGKDSGSVGQGGTGGGGNSNSGSTGTAGAGTANTGGGGGGTHDANPAGAGGSGVVILRLATASYSGTTSGSPTVSTSGSDTILIYNASGTYTA